MTILSRFFSKLRSRGIPSRTETLIGKAGMVTQAIDPNTGLGRILVNGEDWAAHSATTLSINTHVRVKGADGITLIVSPTDGAV